MAEKKPKPVDPPGVSCTPAQMRRFIARKEPGDGWVGAVVAGALTDQPQVVWSEAKAGAQLNVAPVVDDYGPVFRVAP